MLIILIFQKIHMFGKSKLSMDSGKKVIISTFSLCFNQKTLLEGSMKEFYHVCIS